MRGRTGLLACILVLLIAGACASKNQVAHWWYDQTPHDFSAGDQGVTQQVPRGSTSVSTSNNSKGK